MRYVLLFLLGWSWIALSAQDNLKADADWFREQGEVYQKWLDRTGLGQYLRVQEVVVETGEVNLFLNLGTADIDAVVNRWTVLKQDFERTAALTLEEKLFYKARSLFQLRPEQLSVEVYDNYTGAVRFQRMMVYEDGRFRVAEDNPKSKIRRLNLRPKRIDGSPVSTAAEFRQRYSRERVFACVRSFAAARYAELTCELRTPTLEVIGEGDGDVLQFEVTDLCREVLAEESNPLVCSWLNRLGYPCNWIKRELLTYTVSYAQTDEGFRLTLDIDGKVGSGFYDRVGRRGYLSMEADFDEELERYADRIKREFRGYLGGCVE